MRQFVTIIVLTLALNCFGQYPLDKSKISWHTEQTVTRIEKVNLLMSSEVCDQGTRPPQCDNFSELQKKATTDELVELTNHPNGVVRCYSFLALSYDTAANLLPIAIKHIGDTALVITQLRGIRIAEKAGDFFINVVTPQYGDLKSKKLTSAEYDYLDSMLIYTPGILYAKANAISRARLTEAFYTRARELVLKENNQPALVMLAKYKRMQDIPIILNNKRNSGPRNQLVFTYKAISEFPHSSFIPFLRKNLYEAMDTLSWRTEWEELYKAIASFKNDTALQFLKVPFTQVKHQVIRQYHIGLVFEAMQAFYTPIYDELLWEMWGNEKRISPAVFRLLYPKSPEKAYQLTKETIQNADDFYYINSTTDSDEEETFVNLLDVMLDTIIVRDKTLAVELINQNIRVINVHQFPAVVGKALKLKDTSFVASLLARLTREDYPPVFLKAAETLIAFNDQRINKRIVEVSKRNVNLRIGRGGQDFAKLLEENNIK
ncbi:hypothetical protein HB364_17720 [Pseudoflavitalea sp. X16]|uniref:hypothetical protein n=1 Tax=Paraflavitalea devenefica TaxID=2716334 RepID=UPI00142093A0|nr:hypothetical protein [Paraflavitalea devenefica]NII26933.1 hypothetical protein [Paraflavitalea devenefica]